MALRVEYILILSIMVVGVFIFIEEPKSIKLIESNSTKELFFKNFSLLEIDESGVKNQLNAKEATKDKNSFYLIDINITHDKTDNILAKKAIYMKDFIYLKDRVTLKRKGEFQFSTNDLNYRVKDKIAYTNRGFTLKVNQNRINGTNLYYNLKTKEISAKDINASIVSF